MRNKLMPVLLCLVFIGVPVIGQGSQERHRLTDPVEFQKLIESDDENYVLVDVRTKAEYDAGYIPKAINISHELIDDNLPTEDRSALIILYCRSGNRSARAKKTLEGLGFTNVVDFGGISRWRGALVQPREAGG